jgi:hypothetical protein
MWRPRRCSKLELLARLLGDETNDLVDRVAALVVCPPIDLQHPESLDGVTLPTGESPHHRHVAVA